MLLLGKSILSFQPLTETQTEHYAADHYPKGRLWAKRHVKNTIIYNFILTISTVFKLFFGDLFTLVKNRDIDQVSELLEEWETSVRIPEQVPRTETVDSRRIAVKRLKSKIPVYNQEDTGAGIQTTFQQYLRDLTGISELTVVTLADRPQATGAITDHFIFMVGVPSSFAETNKFPLPFAIIFADGLISSELRNTIDILMERVVPSFGMWGYFVIS